MKLSKPCEVDYRSCEYHRGEIYTSGEYERREGIMERGRGKKDGRGRGFTRKEFRSPRTRNFFFEVVFSSSSAGRNPLYTTSEMLPPYFVFFITYIFTLLIDSF